MQLFKLALVALTLVACGAPPDPPSQGCLDHGMADTEPVTPNTCGPGLTLCRTTYYSCEGDKVTTVEGCLDVPCQGWWAD